MNSKSHFSVVRSLMFSFLVLFGGLTTFSLFGSTHSHTQPQSILTVEQRVSYQQKLEQVYWNHRVWPKENPNPKPPLEQVMPISAVRKKVETYLRQSQAMESLFHQPATAAQLQSELDRLASKTQDPQLLRELFSALDNNPYLIAECLARPLLVERQLRLLDSKTNQSLVLNGHSAPSRSKGFDVWRASVADSLPLEIVSPAIEYRLPAINMSARFDPDQTGCERWTPTLSDSTTPRPDNAPTAVWTGTEMIVWSTGGSLDLGTGGRYNPVTDTWTALAAFNAPVGWESTAVWTGTEMIVWGGFGPTRLVNSGGRYNPVTDAWTPTTTTMAPTARSQHTAVWTGREMIIWGGVASDDNGDNRLTNTGGRYNPVNDSWIPTDTTTAPSARSNHTAVWTGKDMIIWGGQANSSFLNTGALNTGARYDPERNMWVLITTTDTPSARIEHTAVWTGHEMIIWGGFGPPPNPNQREAALNTGGRYNPQTNTWVNLPTVNAPQARSRHTAVWTGTEMIVWGGFGTTEGAEEIAFATGGRFDPNTGVWTAIAMGNAPIKRYGHTAVWTGTEMIVWGGTLFQDFFYWKDLDSLNSGGRYNPNNDTWTTTRISGIARGRSGHTAVWTGVEMIVEGSHWKNSDRYFPATDSWVPTATDPMFFGHDRDSAVWTGTDMIVYGGAGPFADPTLSLGWRYSPMTDAWTLIEPLSGRFNHTAIWTGTEMIVWGGEFDDGVDYFLIGSGARYNPSQDTWIGIVPTAENSPTARIGHTAVWTGKEMIIWGGSNTNTGGRYDPVKDTWVPTAPSPLPGRSDHTAVWTGKEMIVWGGRTSLNGQSLTFNSGARYDPETDQWTLINIADAPGARTDHTAVWTGKEMIIWGGNASASPPPAPKSPLGTGARYDPQTDTWLPTISEQSPSPRFLHSAIWTGTEMIVWGGLGPDSKTSITGGRYSLSSVCTPILTQFYPVASTPGKTITITGSGFVAGATQVFFGGERLIPSPMVTVTDSAHLSVVVPQTSKGTGNISGFITIRVEGLGSVTSQTLAFRASNPGDPVATLPEFALWGDIIRDGGFDAEDVKQAKRLLRNQTQLSMLQLAALDVDPENPNGSRGNGVFQKTDLLLLKQVLKGNAKF